MTDVIFRLGGTQGHLAVRRSVLRQFPKVTGFPGIPRACACLIGRPRSEQPTWQHQSVNQIFCLPPGPSDRHSKCSETLTLLGCFCPSLESGKSSALSHHLSFPFEPKIPLGRSSSKQMDNHEQLLGVLRTGILATLPPTNHDRKRNLPAKGQLLAEPQHPVLDSALSPASRRLPALPAAPAQLRVWSRVNCF